MLNEEEKQPVRAGVRVRGRLHARGRGGRRRRRPDMLESLVDKSLIRHSDDASGCWRRFGSSPQERLAELPGIRRRCATGTPDFYLDLGASRPSLPLESRQAGLASARLDRRARQPPRSSRPGHAQDEANPSCAAAALGGVLDPARALHEARTHGSSACSHVGRGLSQAMARRARSRAAVGVHRQGDSHRRRMALRRRALPGQPAQLGDDVAQCGHLNPRGIAAE